MKHASNHPPTISTEPLATVARPQGAARMRRIGGLTAALALALAAGCSSVKLDEGQGAPIEQSRGTAGATQGAGQGAGQGGAAGQQQSSRPVAEVSVAPDPLNDPKSPLAQRSIYFDYDSFVVKDQYRGTVDGHARFLTTNKGRRIVIQGNTDERGSREYNLALGQKRAEAVRRSLSLLGVPESQMEAVSLGEEKPRATGTDEASLSENRRADIVYQ